MKILLAILSLVVASEAGRILTSAPTTFQSRIINGNEVTIDKVPYQVSLQQTSGVHFCSGVIIDEEYVITTATCVVGKKVKQVEVVADTTDITVPKLNLKVKKITVHEKFDNAVNPIENDIALIQVKTKFDFTTTVKRVFPPPPAFEIRENAIAYVSGWGQISPGGGNSNILYKAKVIVIKQETCQTAWNDLFEKILDSHICAYNPLDATGPCVGDDGGPLIVEDYLVGIVVRPIISECGSLQRPAVYTRIPEYVDWIYDTIDK